MGSRSAQTLRGLIAAVFATFVALFAHVAGGGSAPGLAGLELALAMSIVASVALAGKTLSLVRLGSSVGISQLLFHGLFGVGAAGPSEVVMTGMGHHSGAMRIVTTASPATADMGMPEDGWMWAAHATAALVTIVALRRGEQAFWGLMKIAQLRLRALVRVPYLQPILFHPRVFLCTEFLPNQLRELGLLLGVMRHRGPPAPVPSF
jgi:hypothetical protein